MTAFPPVKSCTWTSLRWRPRLPGCSVSAGPDTPPQVCPLSAPFMWQAWQVPASPSVENLLNFHSLQVRSIGKLSWATALSPNAASVMRAFQAGFETLWHVPHKFPLRWNAEVLILWSPPAAHSVGLWMKLFMANTEYPS